MSRTLKYDIPGDDPRRSFDVVRAEGWKALFDAGAGLEAVLADRMVLEIGFGRGEFLLELAASAPNTAFVGIEVSFKRTLKMARKVARAELPNVRLLEGRAEDAIRELFSPGQLAEVWINFSDPWPKLRHAHRRVIQPRFLDPLAQVLAPNGKLLIATDDVPYAHQMDEAMSSDPRFRNLYAPLPFLPAARDRFSTGYELQWKALGRPMHFFEYARLPDTPGAGSALGGCDGG